MLDTRQIVEFIKESGELIPEMQEKIASQKKEIESLNDKLKEAAVQKEAAEKQEPVLDRDKVLKVMEKFAENGKVADPEGAADSMAQNPDELLTFVEKMASEMIFKRAETRKLGKGVAKAQAVERTQSESDRVFDETFLNLGKNY